LRRAIWEDDLLGMKQAIEVGASLSAMRSKAGEPSTALIEATKVSETLVAYLLKQGLDPNEPDAQGFAPLHHARQASVITLLLANGADPSARTRGGLTPLHCCGEPEGCELLLQAGADPLARTRSGSLPWQTLRLDARRWGRASQHEPAAQRCVRAAELVKASTWAALISSRIPDTDLLPTHPKKRF